MRSRSAVLSRTRSRCRASRAARPHRSGALGLVWLLGNSAAVPLLWMQVSAAQHDTRPLPALRLTSPPRWSDAGPLWFLPVLRGGRPRSPTGAHTARTRRAMRSRRARWRACPDHHPARVAARHRSHPRSWKTTVSASSLRLASAVPLSPARPELPTAAACATDGPGPGHRSGGIRVPRQRPSPVPDQRRHTPSGAGTGRGARLGGTALRSRKPVAGRRPGTGEEVGAHAV